MTQTQLKEMDLHALPVDRGPRLPPIGLGLCSRLVMLGHERIADVTQLTPARTHVPADLALRYLRALLFHQTLPDPPRGVTLLARRVLVG